MVKHDILHNQYKREWFMFPLHTIVADNPLSTHGISWAANSSCYVTDDREVQKSRACQASILMEVYRYC